MWTECRWNGEEMRNGVKDKRAEIMFTLEDAVSQERKMMKSPFTPLGRNERSENGQKRKTNNTVSKEQRRDRDRKMHPAHSRVTNLAAFIGGLWDLCFSLTHRQSPVWYSPWQLHVVTNFRVAVWITLQLLNTRPTASVLCLSWTGKRLFDILWHNSFTTSASFVLGFFYVNALDNNNNNKPGQIKIPYIFLMEDVV